MKAFLFFVFLISHILEQAKFGVGYNLRMIRSSAACCSDSAIADLVLHHVPQAQVPLSFPHAGARGGGGLTFQLPLSNKGEFAQLFHELETRLEELHIGNYGISMTTMEDVFLRLSNKDHHDLYRSVGSSSCMLPCNNQQQQEEMMPFSLIETQAPPPSFDSESHASITSSSQNPSSHATAVHFKSHQEQDHGLSAGRTHRATQKTLAHDATVNDDDVHAVEMSSYKTQSPSKKQQHTSSSFGRAFGQIFKKRMLIARRDIKVLVTRHKGLLTPQLVAHFYMII
jgi:hypothetical protein